MKPQSKCCQATMTVFTGSEGTNHWICARCGQPCDPMQNEMLKITIDHEGKRFFNGMPDYEYLKIEALNKIVALLTTKEHHAE